MTYQELRNLFCKHERGNPASHLTAYITFAPESFGPGANYSELERTYAISSNNKAFQPGMGGYSIFGSCLDSKTDPCLRLDSQMAEESGGKTGWIVERCCLVAYLLTGLGECGPLMPQLFYDREAAEAAMLQAFCKAGEFEYDDVRAIFIRDNGEFGDLNASADRNSAEISSDRHGNWAWQIHEVQIYDLLNIVPDDGSLGCHLRQNGHRAQQAPINAATVRHIYTIIHTGVDADRGSFPNPDALGSYSSLAQAQKALRLLVEQEKETRDFHCDEESYQEEYDDTYWEAYENGYAAANFSRFDIVTTQIFVDNAAQQETKEFQAHQKLLLNRSPIALLVQAQVALLESGSIYDDLAMEVADYLAKFHYDGKCPHCGAQLYLSDLPQYGAVCYACQENFF